MAKRGKPEDRRGDWEHNHASIRKEFKRLLKLNKRRPTNDELATATGLHRRTIEAHIKELKFTPEAHNGRLLSEDVLDAILNKALKGDTPAARLWLQVAEQWSLKKGNKKSTDGDDLPEPTGSKVRIYIPDNGRSDR